MAPCRWTVVFRAAQRGAAPRPADRPGLGLSIPVLPRARAIVCLSGAAGLDELLQLLRRVEVGSLRIPGRWRRRAINASARGSNTAVAGAQIGHSVALAAVSVVAVFLPDHWPG